MSSSVIRSASVGTPDIPETTRAEIVKRYLAGERVATITADLGVSKAYVYLVLKQRGIASRTIDIGDQAGTRQVQVVAPTDLLARLEEQAGTIVQLKAEVRDLKRQLRDCRMENASTSDQ